MNQAGAEPTESLWAESGASTSIGKTFDQWQTAFSGDNGGVQALLPTDWSSTMQAALTTATTATNGTTTTGSVVPAGIGAAARRKWGGTSSLGSNA
jgi:hypothetical protein